MTRLALCFFVVTISGCTSDMDLGGNLDGGPARDGAIQSVRTDECGNGVDDDGNGRIDDGCPCGPGETQSCWGGTLATRGVGACMGGTQTCRTTTGEEWGDWGDSGCDGDVLPAMEACNGMDADCDGAIDEQCPCTAGQTRACGQEFVRAPCTAGTQTCRATGWSGCEGAIGPSADVCGDHVDNDCDGTVDDGCSCVPVPEICGDGIDNDCDGHVDELACTPNWTSDAGVDSGIDASRPDAGPSTCVDGTSCLGTPGTLADFGPPISLSGYGSPIHLASSGSRLFALTTDMMGGTSALFVAELAADGTRLWQTSIAPSVSANDVRIVWTGSGLVVAHSDLSSTAISALTLTHVDPSTHAATTLATVDTANPLLGGFGIHDGELAIAWTSSFTTAGGAGGEGRFRRYALDGTALGNPVDLGSTIEPRSVAHVGDAWLVGARDITSLTSLYQVVRNDAVAARVDLVRPATACMAPTGGVVVASCDGGLVCWRDYVTCGFTSTVAERCQTIDRNGALVGTSTQLFTPLRYGPAGYAVWDDLIDTGSEYLLHTEYARQGDFYTTSRTDTLIRLGRDGAVRDIHADTSVAVGYEYGDIVRVDDCIVEMSMGTPTGSDSTTQPRMRRVCDATCH